MQCAFSLSFFFFRFYYTLFSDLSHIIFWLICSHLNAATYTIWLTICLDPPTCGTCYCSGLSFLFANFTFLWYPQFLASRLGKRRSAEPKAALLHWFCWDSVLHLSVGAYEKVHRKVWYLVSGRPTLWAIVPRASILGRICWRVGHSDLQGRCWLFKKNLWKI